MLGNYDYKGEFKKRVRGRKSGDGHDYKADLESKLEAIKKEQYDAYINRKPIPVKYLSEDQQVKVKKCLDRLSTPRIDNKTILYSQDLNIIRLFNKLNK